MTILMPIKVAPRGLPSWRSLARGDEDEALFGESDSDVLSRKSWVMAMPMLAKESEVRSQARNVRSVVLRVSSVVISANLPYLWLGHERGTREGGEKGK